jgi:glycosyltransferase involved in cell wall biosynthesis
MLEAMAFGLPVVVRSVGGIGDIFEDRKMGRLIHDAGVTAVVDALEPLICDAQLRRTIGAFNRAYIRRHCSAARVAALLERTFADLADARWSDGSASQDAGPEISLRVWTRES